MSKRFPLVDSMRALAALSIFAYHVAFVGGGLGADGAGRWLAGLNVGVPLFFAISGFLLYRPWVAARLAHAERPAVGVYALRRTLRIVPAYWVALVIIGLVLGRTYVFHWPDAPVYFGLEQAYFPDLFTGGIGQAWTLTVEVAFYAALPLLGLVARRLPGPVLRGEALLLGGLVAVSVLWRGVVLATVDPTDPAYFPLPVALPAQLDVFAGGMALAVLSAARAGSVRIAPAVLPMGRSADRLLAWRPLAWVGLVSYGVYMWHLDVLRELDEAGLPLWGVAAGGLALTLGLGAASWYGLERPAQRLGRRRREAGADPHPPAAEAAAP